MKLVSPFTILTRFLNAFKNKKMHAKNVPNNYAEHNYWDKECLEHPTNNSCLIYCD